MTQSQELDIGPLSWVRGEIDQALSLAAEAIGRAGEDADQADQIQFARNHLHQARGALSVVGLDGLCHFADTLDTLLAGMADGSIAADEANAGLARRGCSTVANYLGDLVNGSGDQPLRLFALYREIATACGRNDVSPAELFYPDLSRRLPRRKLRNAPRPGTPAGSERMRGARAALERGLLQWLRDPSDRSGPDAMRDAAIALEALQSSPAFYTLWRVAQAFFDALAHQDLPASEMRIKQLCTGLVREVRHQASTSYRIPERLMRDILFEIGQAPVRSPAQRQVREAWNLDAWWNDPGELISDVPLGPLLRKLRSELATAKNDWDAFGSGQASALQDFDNRIQTISAEAGRLGRPALLELLTGTARVTQWLRGDPAANGSEALAVEVATALLLAELSIEGGIADSELASQGASCLARLDAIMAGEALPAAREASLDGTRSAHEWDARQQVAREIASNLGHIEQTLDDFFRNHAKRAPLAQLAAPMRQIEGALALIEGEQAIPLVREAIKRINDLANSELEPDEDQLNRLADQLSTLGFFVSALQHGQADLNDFLPPDQRKQAAELDPGFELDFDESVEAIDLQPLEAPAEPPQRVAAPAMSAPAPETDAEVDAELLAIFIEEAHDVLGNIAEGLATVTPHGNQDALVDIRRGFHTLKGSGRMVGLTDFGEAAWAIEQTLNRWLQLELPVTEELHALIASSHQSFTAWVAQIEGGGSHAFDFSTPAAEAERLRGADADNAPGMTAQPAAAPVATPESAPPEAAEVAAPEPSAERDESISETLAEPFEAPALPSFDFGDLPSLELDAPAEPVDPAPSDDLPALELEDAQFTSEREADAPQALDDDTATPAPAADEAVPNVDALETADAPAAADEAAEVAEVGSQSTTVRIGEYELSRQLYDLYLNEAREHLDVLASELKPLRRNPGKPSDKLQRTAHTLSGISGTARIPALQNLARALEFAFDRLRQTDLTPSPEQVDLLMATVSTLQAMLTEVTRGQQPLEVPELEQQLDAIGRPPVSEEQLADLAAQEDTSEEVAPSVEPAPPAAAESAPAPARNSAAPIAEDEAAVTVHDDLDEQLLPIFLEEADELMSGLSERLRLWQADNANPEHARLAARQLHTLKGSARMAGAMKLGEHVHRIESRLENGLARQHDASRLIDDLTGGLDLAAQLIAGLSGEQPATAAPIAGAPTQADQPLPAAIAIETGETPAEPAQAGGTLRVRAETLGGFINTAGEIGIARTRIEGELRVLRRSLLDLTENVIRLRNQLREVELQAETQMQSRIAQADSAHGEFDPLEMDRYTRLQELTRMMAESVGDVTTVQQQLLRNLDGAELALHSQARFARDLQQALMQVRMVPFDSLADRLHRVVRQSAKDLSKRVNLDIRGGRIEIDRSVLERMTIAVEHMLRNAVAHGIESVEARRAAGKDEIGQISLTVLQIGNEIAIDLSDDGRGLDYAAIRARGIERGLLQADEEADERKLTNLIFTSGFSTAESVSTIAGRGVGMDVVRAEAAALGGRIDVHASEGQGTRFRIYLPLTLAVTQALLVRAGTASYAIPSSMIAQAMELRADAIERVRADGFVEWQGQRFNYRYLPELLGDRRTRPEIHRFNWVLLLRAGGESLAVHVDSLRGNHEIVVKSAGPQLLRIVGISGATVLGDGEIMLILNPIALASRSVAPETSAEPAAAHELVESAAPAESVRVPTVMVVDDSLTVRKITGRLLEREGYRVITAKDGTDALDQLEEALPDVILSDIEMPRMDGFEFVRNLRADERMRDVPVIMITSRLADKHREYAQKLGANEYLGKPYDEDELLRLLQQYVTPATTH
ncbi:MAG: Hpt domain-containing protein [Pseudazoarcus pumilus]|nr:Hpt domain-containing protein [Pseudazoarcus pumilus]